MKNNTDQLFKNKLDGYDKIPSTVEWNSDQGWHDFNLLNKSQKRKKLRYGIYTIAAILILLIASLFFLQNEQIIIRNNTNEVLAQTLSNGDKVWLNANSSITHTEDITIVNGEVYFENTQPINILVANTIITSDGNSAFNIRCIENEEHVNITMAKGVVKIKEKENLKGLTTILTAGNYCSIHKSQKIIFSAKNTNCNFLAWKTGKIEFHNETMSTVSEVLAQYYHKEIDFENIEVAYCQYTGNFENKNIDEVLNEIRTNLNIEIEITGNKITFSGKGCL